MVYYERLEKELMIMKAVACSWPAYDVKSVRGDGQGNSFTEDRGSGEGEGEEGRVGATCGVAGSESVHVIHLSGSHQLLCLLSVLLVS